MPQVLHAGSCPSHKTATANARVTRVSSRGIGTAWSTQLQPLPGQSGRVVHMCCAPAGGFGKKNVSTKPKKAKDEKPVPTFPSPTSAQGVPPAYTERPAPPAIGATKLSRGTATSDQLKSGYWNEILKDVDAFFQQAGKDIKAVELAAKRTVVLYRHQGVVYCSDVSSTAYQFPMIDAKITPGENGPSVEVPLDGTVYDLRTGKVLKWCPNSDNMLRNVFASLKRTSDPIDLPVFPTLVSDKGALWIRL